MISFVIGIAAILLGVKGFSDEGLPFTSKKRLNGTAGKVTGVVCILIGALFLLDGAFAIYRMSR